MGHIRSARPQTALSLSLETRGSILSAEDQKRPMCAPITQYIKKKTGLEMHSPYAKRLEALSGLWSSARPRLLPLHSSQDGSTTHSLSVHRNLSHRLDCWSQQTPLSVAAPEGMKNTQKKGPAPCTILWLYVNSVQSVPLPLIRETSHRCVC